MMDNNNNKDMIEELETAGNDDEGCSYPQFFRRVDYTVAVASASSSSTTNTSHGSNNGGDEDDKVFANWYHPKKKKNKKNDTDTITPVEEYTFGQIWKDAGRIAYHVRFHNSDCQKGDRVILLYDLSFSRLHFFVVFLGCLRAGVIPILVDYSPPPSSNSNPATANATTTTTTSTTTLNPSDLMATTTAAVAEVFGSSLPRQPSTASTSASSPCPCPNSATPPPTFACCPFIQSLIHLQRILEDCTPALILTDTMVNQVRKADQYNLFSKSRRLWPSQDDISYLVTDTILTPKTNKAVPKQSIIVRECSSSSSQHSSQQQHPSTTQLRSPAEDVLNLMITKANETTATLLSARNSISLAMPGLVTSSNNIPDHQEERQYHELDTTSNDIAFIQYTSGTTGDRPKAVAVSFSSLWANITIIGQDTLTKLDEDDAKKTRTNAYGSRAAVLVPQGEVADGMSCSSPIQSARVIGASWLVPHETNLTSNLISSFMVPFVYGWRQHYIFMSPTISSSSSSFPISSSNDHQFPLLHHHHHHEKNNLNMMRTKKKKKKKKTSPLERYFRLLAKTGANIGYVPAAAALAAAAGDCAFPQAIVQTHSNNVNDDGGARQQQKDQLDLSALRGIVLGTGGEPMHPYSRRKLVDAFRKCGLPRQSFLACFYCLAEAVSGVCFLTTSIQDDHGDDVELSSTRPTRQTRPAGQNTHLEKWKPTEFLASACRRDLHPSVVFKVVDPVTHTDIITSGQTGELWIAGPTTRNFYYNRDAEELSKETFQAHLSTGRYHNNIDSSNNNNNSSSTANAPRISYLRTGDLAFSQGDHLFICGPMEDKIILNTANHHNRHDHGITDESLLVLPQDIEYLVQESSPLVQAGCVAAFSSSTTSGGGASNNNTDQGSNTGTVEIVFEICNEGKDQARDICRRIRSSVAQSMGFAPSRVVAIVQNTIPKTAGVARPKVKRRNTQRKLHTNELQVLFDLKSIGWLQEKAPAMCHHADAAYDDDDYDPSHSHGDIMSNTAESTASSEPRNKCGDDSEDPEALTAIMICDYDSSNLKKAMASSVTTKKEDSPKRVSTPLHSASSTTTGTISKRAGIAILLLLILLTTSAAIAALILIPGHLQAKNEE